ncbi:hypothetical protein EKG40_23740 [Pseudomonas moorei]|nr:hypothetical protein EKG40_23740 [Pseudomonas moorei]
MYSVHCRSEPAPGGVPTINVQATWVFRQPASSLTPIASRRWGFTQLTFARHHSFTCMNSSAQRMYSAGCV